MIKYVHMSDQFTETNSVSLAKNTKKDVSWPTLLHFGFEMRPEVFWVVHLILIGNKTGRMLVVRH
jgi:hypothetical protein